MSKVQRLTVGLAALLFGASLAACASGGTVATVNGQPISQSAFDTKLEGTPLARTVLQQMVQDVLIDQYAKNNNITVSDAEINAREDQIKQNFPAGSWDEMLKSRGLTEDDVHSALREQLILDKALGSQVKITPAQISDYFDKNRATFDKPEQVTARHILVPNLAEAEKVEQLLKIRIELRRRREAILDRSRAARTKAATSARSNAARWCRHSTRSRSREPVNAISPPVKSPFGYHIIQVEARIPGTKATLASATPQITDTLRQQQEAPLIQPFLQGLQQKADIKINNPNFAGLFPSPPPGSAMGAPPAAAGAGAAASPAGSAPAASPAAASPAPSST